MGAGMAKNLLEKGFQVSVYDLVPENVAHMVALGATGANTPAETVKDADVVISMLPAGKHVMQLYFGENNDGIVFSAKPNTLFIDSSTIEAQTAKKIASGVIKLGHRFCDAPVSGGVAGAAAGTLTFILGGSEQDVAEAKAVLGAMGQNIFHAGDIGAGQIAKICNNMLLAILMTGTSEALQLAIDNGLDPKVMSQIMQKSSGSNWTLEKYNPCPDIMPNVPSSNGYQGGFMVNLMNKDLGLAMDTAAHTRSTTPMGALAKSLYQIHGLQGNGQKDFSSIFQMFTPKS